MGARNDGRGRAAGRRSCRDVVQVAKAWAKGRSFAVRPPDLDWEGFDEALVDAFVALVDHLGDMAAGDFMAALREEAQAVRIEVALGGGVTGMAVVQCFAIAAYGDRLSVLGSFSDRRRLAALTRSVEAAGLTDGAASVALMPTPVPVLSLARMWPGDLREIANAFARREFGAVDEEAFVRETLAVLSQDEHEGRDGEGYLILGARAWIGTDARSGSLDHFARFDRVRGRGDGGSRHDAWIEAAEQAMPDVTFGAPNRFDAACVDAITLDVRERFRCLKRSAGLPERAWPDKVHVHMDGDLVTTCMERRGLTFGPVTFPEAAIQSGDLMFLDGLRRISERVVYHDGLATMPHAGGRADPPPRRDSFDAEPAHSLRLIHEAVERRRLNGARFVVTVDPAHGAAATFGPDNWDVLVDFLDECVRMEPANGNVADVVHSVFVRRFEDVQDVAGGPPWRTVVGIAATRDWIGFLGEDELRGKAEVFLAAGSPAAVERVRYVGAGDMFPELRAVVDRRA